MNRAQGYTVVLNKAWLLGEFLQVRGQVGDFASRGAQNLFQSMAIPMVFGLLRDLIGHTQPLSISQV
jgi:hypothetical protein